MRTLALIAWLAATPLAAAAPAADDEDFEPDRGARSLALGPLPGGAFQASLDLGWLRSGARFDVGLAGGVDLVLRAETMLLYDRLDGQNGVHLGLRYTPFVESAFRLGGELTVGKVLIPTPVETVALTAVRGELFLGATFEFGNVYARLAVRGVDPGMEATSSWERDEEVGLGVERALGRWVLGAEAFAWARQRHSGMGQWRIRVGFAP